MQLVLWYMFLALLFFLEKNFLTSNIKTYSFMFWSLVLHLWFNSPGILFIAWVVCLNLVSFCKDLIVLALLVEQSSSTNPLHCQLLYTFYSDMQNNMFGLDFVILICIYHFPLPYYFNFYHSVVYLDLQ